MIRQSKTNKAFDFRIGPLVEIGCESFRQLEVRRDDIVVSEARISVANLEEGENIYWAWARPRSSYEKTLTRLVEKDRPEKTRMREEILVRRDGLGGVYYRRKDIAKMLELPSFCRTFAYFYERPRVVTHRPRTSKGRWRFPNGRPNLRLYVVSIITPCEDCVNGNGTRYVALPI